MKKPKAEQSMADCISCKEGCPEGFRGNEDRANSLGNGSGWQMEEGLLKNSLQNIGGRIEASDSLKQRIDDQVESRSMKEERRMKHMSIKKVMIGVAAACLAVGMVTVAGKGLISISGHSSSIPDYTKFEDLEKAETKIGYSIDAVENFSNGFQFEDVRIVERIAKNEAGEKLGEQKGVSIGYTKGKDELAVYVSKLFPGETSFSYMDWDKTLTVGDITVGYSKNTYKAVPPDYELTEEDKANMEKGHFQLAYGTEQVEISQSYCVGWVKDGIQYSINGFDLSQSGDELLNMAKEIIESGAE